MGCDIHLSVQVKDWSERFRTLTERFQLDRDYAVFAAMANVRNGDSREFICEPRGLPADMNVWDREQFLENSGADHSFSYLSVEEYKKALVLSGRNFEKSSIGDGFDYKALECLLDFLTERGLEARIIFGFDS